MGSTGEEPEERTANSDTRNSADPKQDKPTQCCGLSSVKKASRRAASVFTVENPHNIDRHARTLFPMAFLFVNILYWLYYLFLWAFSFLLLLCRITILMLLYLHVWGQHQLLLPDLITLANWITLTIRKEAIKSSWVHFWAGTNGLLWQKTANLQLNELVYYNSIEKEHGLFQNCKLTEQHNIVLVCTELPLLLFAVFSLASLALIHLSVQYNGKAENNQWLLMNLFWFNIDILHNQCLWIKHIYYSHIKGGTVKCNSRHYDNMQMNTVEKNHRSVLC